MVKKILEDVGFELALKVSWEDTWKEEDGNSSEKM